MSWGRKARKFTPGVVLRTPAEVLSAFNRRQWIFMGGVAKHPSFAMNLQMGTLFSLLERGSIRLAVRNPAAWYQFRVQHFPGDGYCVMSGEFPVSAEGLTTRRQVVNACVAAVKKHAVTGPHNVRVEFFSVEERFEGFEAKGEK